MLKKKQQRARSVDFIRCWQPWGLEVSPRMTWGPIFLWPKKSHRAPQKTLLLMRSPKKSLFAKALRFLVCCTLALQVSKALQTCLFAWLCLPCQGSCATDQLPSAWSWLLCRQLDTGDFTQCSALHLNPVKCATVFVLLHTCSAKLPKPC